MSAIQLKPTHKAIAEYHGTLGELAAQSAATEGNLRRAFGQLLHATSKVPNWTLIEEYTTRSSSGEPIRYDGLLRDANTLPRGVWEAKDSTDNLTKEVAKKKAKGYSLVTIFEDTRSAILYQNGKPHDLIWPRSG